MHWPVAWKRGDELFPEDDGSRIVENIDIVDVRTTHHLSSRIHPSLVRATNFSEDIPRNGEAVENWQGSCNWRFKL